MTTVAEGDVSPVALAENPMFYVRNHDDSKILLIIDESARGGTGFTCTLMLPSGDLRIPKEQALSIIDADDEAKAVFKQWISTRGGAL